MEFFKKITNIDFMGMRYRVSAVSILLCSIALMCVIIRGINVGLEFTGGMQIDLRFKQETDPALIKQKLEKQGLKDLRVQHQGSSFDITLRTAQKLQDDGHHGESEVNMNLIIQQILLTAGYDQHAVEIRKIEYIGAEVGKNLVDQGSLAVILAIVATMLYIALRFEYKFAISAALALCHDAILVLGLFSIFQFEFDLATLAAILAILGYSLNDTIVVFDRVRENLRKMRKGTVLEVMNIAINQTLSRTIMTSLLTLLVVFSLLIFGGDTLFGFAVALCSGIIIGTYSSIYIAGTTAVLLGLSRADLLAKPKAIVDDLP